MTSRRAVALRIFCWAALWGLIGGFLESIARSLLPWAPPFRIHLGGYLWWMPAVSNLIWFTGLGGGVALAAMVRPQWYTAARLAAGFGWLGILNMLVLFSPPLHRAAVMVLAAGMALAVARLVAARPAVADRWAIRGALALAGVAAAIAVGVELTRRAHEASALRTPPPRGDAPNILLLVLDNVGARQLGAYGYFRPTSPTIGRIAGRGVLFERAYATSSWSLPSHASLMTGRWAHELEAGWRVPLAPSHATLAEVFGAHGYATGGFVANGAYTQRETGLSQGFARYEDYPLSLWQVLMSSRFGLLAFNAVKRRLGALPGPPSDIWHRRSAADLHERVVQWIDGIDDRPFLVFVNYFDAHVPYYAPPDLQPFSEPPPAPGSGIHPDAALPFSPEAANELYDRSILGIDREIGRLLDSLEARDQLANTIVIVTSDHGEEFEEHGIFGHGNTLYEAGLRIPLIVAGEGVPAGRVVETPVSLREVAATLLDVADLREHELPGCSLARHWTDSVPRPADTLFAELRQGINTDPEYPVSRGDMIAVLVGRWHLIRNGDGRFELYDLETDPWEQRDLAGDSAGSNVMAALRRQIDDPPSTDRCGGPPPAR